MSIRTRVLLVLLTLFALFGAADLAIRMRLVWPSFEAWEQQAAAAAVERFEQRLQQELGNLDQRAADWASWDESYRFGRDRNPRFSAKQLTGSDLAKADIDLVAIYNADGKRLLERNSAPIRGEVREQLVPATLTPGHRLRRFSTAQPLPARRVQGLLITTQGPWLMVSRPLLSGGGEGPVTGLLVLARRLDAARVASYAAELALPLALHWEAPRAPIEGTDFARAEGTTRFNALGGLRLQASRQLIAADGNAAVRLDASVPRELTQLSYANARRAWGATAALGLVMLLILATLLHHSLVRPILHLTRVMRCVVAQDNFSLRPRIKRRDEIGQLSVAFEELLQRIESQNAARHLQSQRLQKLAGTDALTGIANRRALEEYLEQCWSRSRQQQLPMAMILCDIDHFKRYNDRYGHLEGDACLQRVARIMEQHIHRPGDRLFRYGGEEFAVVLPNTERDGALQLAEKLRRAVQRLQLEHQDSPNGVVTLSLGVASAIGGSAPERLLIDAADRALYDSKESGRNRTTVGHPLAAIVNAGAQSSARGSESA